MRQITLFSIQLIFFAAIVFACDKEDVNNCSHDNAPKGYVEVDSDNPKVIFAAKVSLEEYEYIKGHRGLIYDKVLKAEKQDVDNGVDYHVNYKTHLKLSLFPVYICDALVYKDDKDVFYVKEVECKPSLYWP